MAFDNFKNKFLLTTFCLVVTIFALSIIFYLSILRLQFLEERNSLAQHVASSYISVSNYAYRKLNAMSEIVSSGTLTDEEARIENEARLKKALAEVRLGIEREISLARGEPEHEEIYHFAEIERIAERIIDGGKIIRQSISDNDISSAKQALSLLRSKAVAGRLNELLDEAIQEEKEEALESLKQLEKLVKQIKTALPVLLILILTPIFYFVISMSRRLTTSISTLNTAAETYASGNLSHKTLVEGDQEFVKLGITFNNMAQELLLRRTSMEESQISLEYQVSERTKELEKLNKRLEILDASRRQFLADISHELKSPLTVIQGEAEVALRGTEKTPIEYQETLERVRQQTLHTTHLVNDLLFVARAEDGKARINKRSVAVKNLLESVCFDFQTIASKKELNLFLNTPEKELMVHGDMERLRQVFTILLDNAIRYSHPKGRIDVSLVLQVDQEHIVVCIIDEGIGMSQEDIDQAFYRFYRGANAERHADGTGLGLPVAKAIVEAHDGEISLSSRPQKGIKATVQLPFGKDLGNVA